MAFNIGVNVIEVDGSASPTIPSAAVSVGAFNIVTWRGIPNRPALITSLQQFTNQFGSFFPAGLGAYLVKGFFDNGGQTAYVNRVVSTDPTNGASAASSILQDNASPAANTLTVEAGFLGLLDPGTWGNNLYIKVDDPTKLDSTTLTKFRLLEVSPATISGTPLTEPINMSGFPSLSVVVDGEATATVLPFQANDFANATQATLLEIRDAINRRTSKLVASISSDKRLVLTSTGAVASLRKGWTSLIVSAANPTLGFANAMTTATQGTPAPRSQNSTQLTNTPDLNVGDVLHIFDGPADTPTHSAFVKILTITPTTGAVQWTPAVPDIANYDPFQTKISKAEFNLSIAYGGTATENIVETWSNLSMESDLPNYAPKVLNDPIQGSRYVTIIDNRSASAPGIRNPKPLQAFTQFTTPGSDGTAIAKDFIGDQAKHTGFYAFDPFDVQLVCCELTDPAVVNAALAYCANRGDCMYIGSVPQGFVAAGQAVAYGQTFQGKKVYGALYGPFVKIFDPVGTGPNPSKWIPPVGHVMGVYARVANTRGVWKAPAGDEANLLGALDVEYRLSDADHTNLVKNGSINGIRIVPGAGIVIDASRTLSTDTRWLYVNVRLLFNYVKSSLKQGTRWVRQEPNRDTLWNAVKFNSVIPFLIGLWRQGAFGTGAPNEVFTVICDASNNPPDQVDQGNFKLEVYFYPSKPAETIIIIVGQQASGAKATEA